MGKTIKVDFLEKLDIGSIENILQELKKELKNIYGERLKELILYGSMQGMKHGKTLILILWFYSTVRYYQEKK